MLALTVPLGPIIPVLPVLRIALPESVTKVIQVPSPRHGVRSSNLATS
jgi:hypothetical protein